MRRLALLIACILPAACAPARRAWQPQPSPPGAATPSAYVVVPLSVPLATAPRDDAPVVWAIAPQHVYSGTSSARFGAFRVVREEGAWVAIETLGEPPTVHCGEGIEALEPFRLRLFVRARSLVPLTQREIAHSFSDGTRIELARGAPLEPLPQRDLFRAHLGAAHTVVQLTSAEVGTRYLPSAALPRTQAARALRGDVLAASVPVLGHTGRVGASAPFDLAVYAEDPRGGESIVEVRPPCARLVVRVPAHATIDSSAQAEETHASDLASDGLRARRGTRVLWRDGRDAGVVTREVSLGRESEPAGQLRCFLHPLRGADDLGDPSASIELCFPRRSLAAPGTGLGTRLDDPR